LLEHEAGKINEVLSDTDLDPVASRWTYTRYINEMVFPYWQKQGTVNRIEDLWNMGSTEAQLAYGTGRVHVVVTEDDPLNTAEDIQNLKRRFGSSTLTVLPHGGHLGYIGSNWAKDRLRKIFQ
jgi:pimeloyl-ACP methyl ester carboxylesterase